MQKRAGAALPSTVRPKTLQGRRIFVGYPLMTKAGPSEQTRMMARESAKSLPRCSAKCPRVNRTATMHKGQLRNATSSEDQPQLKGAESRSKKGIRPSSLSGVGIRKLSRSDDNTVSFQIGP